MLHVSDVVNEVRNGNMEAKKWLIDYYIDRFTGFVIKYSGKEYEPYAYDSLVYLIDKYFDEGLIYNLTDYLNDHSRKLAKRLNSNQCELKYLFENPTDKNIDLLVKHYKKKLIEVMDKGFLSEEQLDEFASVYLKKIIIDFVDKKYDYKNAMTLIFVYINNLKRFSSNKDFIYRKYLLMIKKDRNIINYFIKKYKYLLEEYKDTRYYNYLSCYYKDIVKQAVTINIKSSLEKAISSMLIQKKLEYYKIQKEKEQEKVDIDKKDYEYIKISLINKYKDVLDENILSDLIDEKMDAFIEDYKKVDSEIKLPRYLQCRLSGYMKRKVPYEINKSNTEEINNIISECYYIYYKYQNKHTRYYPFEKMVYQEYENICKECCAKQAKDKHSYINLKLRNYVLMLNDKYDENYLNDVANTFKKSNMLNSNDKEMIINNLLNFYLKQEKYNSIMFDEYLFNSLRYFDLDKYNELKKELTKIKK